MLRAIAVLGFGLAACAAGSASAPRQSPPGRPLPPAASATGSTAGPPAPAEDAWRATCAAVSTCGACLNSPPCSWCEGDSRCVSPRTACAELRVTESSACYTAPLEVARKRHPELAQRLGSYESVRETKSFALASFRQERFFLNAGDCFAVLGDSTAGGSVAGLDLQFAVQEAGTPDPARKKPQPEPGTGARGQRATLSPELCPWEPIYLVVTWLTPSSSATGELRLQLLRRQHPDPARLAQQTGASSPLPAQRAPIGGSCSDYECGEDCRSELRACNLDCFRYGRHEMGSDSMCKAGCNQALRSCERSCRVACPR